MSSITEIRTNLEEKFPHQPTFLQTVAEVLDSVGPYLEEMNANADDYRRLERLLTPERIITFRVTWEDDDGVLQHNTGYRVQYSSVLGPYKGGLRFDPSVNEDVLKFLGFEQIFKNALTGLPLGGAKGGSDFNPKGKSDREIRRFCRAFMLELYRHIGLDTDVPAGDIGVGGREIGYLYGMYRQITNRNEGVLTGKDELFGGSCRRTEATGHGVVYMAELAAEQAGLSLDGMKAVVSGSGNVAEHTARLLIEKGVTVLTLSDRSGYIVKESGLTRKDIDTVMAHKREGNGLGTLSLDGVTYHEGKPWQQIAADAYFPCATQNEAGEEDAKAIVAHAKLLIEGANMPLAANAVHYLQKSNVVYVPGKAANAGGVAVSGLEMAQNASHLPWECERVEDELKKIMQRIHERCVEYGKGEDGTVDYVRGANIGGFVRVFAGMGKLGW